MSTLKSAATKIAEAIEYVNESGILPEDSRAQLREVELSVSSAFDFFTDKLNETPALNQDTDEHENQKILNHTKAAQLAADMRFRIKWLLACQQRDENRRNAELSLKIAFDQHFKDSDTLKERGTRIYRSALRNELLQPSFLKRTGDAIGEFADTFATSFRGKKNEEKPFSLSEGLEQLLPQLTLRVPEDAVLVGVQPNSPRRNLPPWGSHSRIPKTSWLQWPLPATSFWCSARRGSMPPNWMT